MAEQIALSGQIAHNRQSAAVSSVELQASEDVPEIEWVRRAQRGEIEAFDWLIERYRDRAIRLASQVTRRPAEAEDIVQEAFLRAFAQIRSFRSDCAFYTWLYRIVVRQCLNCMRKRAWITGELRIEAISPNTASLQSPGPSDSRLVIDNLMDRLSPPLRAALVLREVEGMEYEEISLALGIPVGTVKSRLNSARNQFQELWKKVQEETSNA